MTQGPDTTGLGAAAGEDEAQGPAPQLNYVGKYKLSMDIGAGGSRVVAYYLTLIEPFAGVGFTTAADQAAVIALYTVADTSPVRCVLQATPVAATQPTWAGAFLMLQVSDPYAVGMMLADRYTTRQFVYERRGNELRLLIPEYDSYLLVAGNPQGSLNLSLFIDKRGGFWASASWRLTAINEWRPDRMDGADLRQVYLARRALGAISLVGADLRNASFGGSSAVGAKLNGAKCSGTSFSNTELQGADFTGATVDGAWFDGVQAQGALFPKIAFTGATFQGGAKRTSFSGATLTEAVLDGRDLTGADLSQATLTGAHLIGATLAGVDLTGAKLGGALLDGAQAAGFVLSGADLAGARLPGAHLERAKLDGATLTRANLAGAAFDTATDLTGTKLVGVDLSGCDLTKPKLSATPRFYDAKPPSTTNPRARMVKATIPVALLGLDWSMLDLSDATIVGSLQADLTGFVAEWAIFPRDYAMPDRTLTGASFKNAELPGVDLSRAKGDSEKPTDFSGATMRGTKLSGANLRGALFVGATLHGIKMSQAKLATAQFGGAHLDSVDGLVADLTYADLTNADFGGAYLGSSQAQLSGANFSYALFYGTKASLAKATLVGAQFNNAYLVAVDFQNVEGKALQGASFAGACLANCKFNGTSLLNVSFPSACLQGANFTDASLFGALMTNAAIAKEEGTLKIIGPGVPPTVKYNPTIIATSSTNGDTTCPSSNHGPCSDNDWKGDKAPMTEWTFRGGKATEDG